MDINQNLRESAKLWGADLFGVAELAPARDAVLAQGGSDLAEYPKSISIGIRLLDTIVDRLPHRLERSVAVDYRHHAYDTINQRLDLIASQVSSLIQNQDFRAYPIPASRRVNDEKICAAFSHKLGAHLAGLGWIGKSCLLVTPQAGPRVRWATVLTDAPLTTTGTPMEQRCNDCHECVDICPAHAFSGRNFKADEPRESRYDARKCEEYFREMEKQRPGQPPVCGLCVYACPHGK